MACCTSCAKGETCESECSSRSASFGALGFFVGMDDVEALDAKIRNLETDVDAITSRAAKNNAEAVAQAELIAKFAPYKGRWRGWVKDHYSTLSRTGAGAVQDFEAFQAEYNELLRVTAKLGPTSATPSAQQSGTLPGLSDTSVKYATVAVVAIVGAYIFSKAT